jgi:hypothetical protein
MATDARYEAYKKLPYARDAADQTMLHSSHDKEWEAFRTCVTRIQNAIDRGEEGAACPSLTPYHANLIRRRGFRVKTDRLIMATLVNWKPIRLDNENTK